MNDKSLTPNNDLTIRAERPADVTAVRQVLSQAFGKPDEADLVDRLRQAGVFTLALVAEVAGQVVGHILFTPVTVDSSTPFQAIGLGPVGILPAYQSLGIGSQLISAGLIQCRQLGHTLIFVLGHATYYPRFGFTPTRPYGITSAFPVPDEVFMLVELEPGVLNGRTGIVHYHPAFDGV